MVESSYSLSLLNKPSRNSRLPPSLGNLAPSLLNLLEKEQIKSEPELFLKSNEILFALLSSAEPGLFRDFMRAEGKRLMDLNHPDLPEKVCVHSGPFIFVKHHFPWPTDMCAWSYSIFKVLYPKMREKNQRGQNRWCPIFFFLRFSKISFLLGVGEENLVVTSKSRYNILIFRVSLC